MLKLLDHLLGRVLPMPSILAAALRDGTVRVARVDGGGVAYVIAQHCADKEAIKKAIDQRRAWELAATVVVSSAVVVLLAALAQLIIH
ncbi:hypothetical protein [Burkholderia ambifaria]|uniref:hypothetical protein n=1 Tax=Burkholderia ambifaria TaxID=152480 RepID=UPI002FE1334D